MPKQVKTVYRKSFKFLYKDLFLFEAHSYLVFSGKDVIMVGNHVMPNTVKDSTVGVIQNWTTVL